MQPLNEMQAAFASAVRDADKPVPDPLTSHTGNRPPKRFNVYRNNVHASLISVLEGRFPAVSRLVGPEFFAAMAHAYISRFPPSSPILMEYGESFAAFLESFEPVADLPYLPDVARIEWAWNLAYYAEDREAVELATLEQIPPDKIGMCTFELHPSLSVVRSDFPVVTIWTANVEESEPDPIDAGAGGETAMVLRPDSVVEVRRLLPGGAEFIEALQNGKTLSVAASAGQQASREFDLQSNLAGLFKSGAIVSVRANGNGPGEEEF